MTESGRRLLALLLEEGAPSGAVPVLQLNIAAIEQEAVEVERVHMKTEIERLPEMVGEPNDGGYSLVQRTAVLALLEAR